MPLTPTQAKPEQPVPYQPDPQVFPGLTTETGVTWIGVSQTVTPYERPSSLLLSRLLKGSGSPPAPPPPPSTGALVDTMRRNPGLITGTPTVVPGLLTVDQNTAYQFDGSTNSALVPDAASLSFTGSMSLEFLFKVSALPGSTVPIMAKQGSYTVSLSATGKLLWKLENGASTVTVTSATTVQLNTTYHVVVVYNGEFAGTPQIGVVTQGSQRFPIPADQRQGAYTNGQNIQVAKTTMPERGLISQLSLGLIRTFDATSPEYLAAVLYADSNGSPGALIAQSSPLLIQPSETFMFQAFPLAAMVEPGVLWQGVIAGSGFAELGPISLTYETTGGAGRQSGAHQVSASGSTDFTGSAPDPFGTVGATDANDQMSIYSDYTPIARTGLEGKAMIYLNGGLDASSNYTSGIAHTAAELRFAESLAITLDEFSCWSRALMPVEIATHFTAR